MRLLLRGRSIRFGFLTTCSRANPPLTSWCVRALRNTWRVEARINRATYYELVALAVPEWVGNKRVLGVWSRGQFFSLGELPPGEA